MKIEGLVSDAYETAAQNQKSAVDADAFKEKLSQAASSKDTAALKEACQQFESYFVNMMFKEMRRSVGESGLTDKSFARSTFEGMLDEEMSSEISKSGGIGISDMLYKSLSRAYQMDVDVTTPEGESESKAAQSAKGLDLMG